MDTGRMVVVGVATGSTSVVGTATGTTAEVYSITVNIKVVSMCTTGTLILPDTELCQKILQ